MTFLNLILGLVLAYGCLWPTRRGTSGQVGFHRAERQNDSLARQIRRQFRRRQLRRGCSTPAIANGNTVNPALLRTP
jgi:hypothetical protein